MSSTLPAEPKLEIPLACNLNALDAGCRSEHIANAGDLLSGVALERQESVDGLSFRFAAEHFSRVAEFIANERLCCPFFHFSLEVSPAQGPIWLHITGPGGAKAFLKSELSLN